MADNNNMTDNNNVANDVDEAHLRELKMALESAKESIAGHRDYHQRKVQRGREKAQEYGDYGTRNTYNWNAHSFFHDAAGSLEYALEWINEAIDSVELGNKDKKRNRKLVHQLVADNKRWGQPYPVKELELLGEEIEAGNADAFAVACPNNPPRDPFAGRM